MRLEANISACGGNGWTGPRKDGIGGEAGENDRSAICRGLSSMHDNQLLSVQSFKRRVGPWSGNGQAIVRPWSHRGSVSDTGFRWAIAPTSSTAQGLLLRRSARNLQGALSRVCCQLYGWYNIHVPSLSLGVFCVYDGKRGWTSFILVWMCQMQGRYQ